ncbi:hypothetical protein [Shewanella donghaensis]|uniref:hypothetical protein n=1 Tax=Shewanella donghaensis TaxID=238836 RepID=UPI001183F0B8|nr:hypothetical protein [Shewanella donghaensis]
MEHGSPTFSKSLKKKVYKQQEAARVDSFNSRDTSIPGLKERLLSDNESYTVLNFDKQVFFPISFREALKKNYSLIVALYEESIEAHNLYIAGGRYPEDAFDWFNQAELSELQQKLRVEFSAIGKNLAYKKRRLTAFNAQLFLYQNILSPLDQFTFYEGRRLQLFFEHTIDLLVQSFLSEFIHEHISLPAKNDFHNPASINYQGFCQSPNEVPFLDNQIGLYNVRDYIIAESCIKSVLYDIKAAKDKPLQIAQRDNRANMIFDIYELIPLYIRSWDSNKNKIIINDKLAIFLFMEFGFPSFAIGKPEDHAEIHTTSTFRFAWSVTHDFWCMAKQDCKLPELELLGDYVLNEFHNKLLSLYSIRQTEKIKSSNVDTIESEYADFTYKYHEVLDEKCASSTSVKSHNVPITKFRPVPSVSMSYFFNFMIKTFDCQVENGKGSEMKIWRKGTAIFTLGKHKQDQQIHSSLIRRVLKRLDISTDEWLSAFIKR